jgi:hypothetical protein
VNVEAIMPDDRCEGCSLREVFVSLFQWDLQSDLTDPEFSHF